MGGRRLASRSDMAPGFPSNLELLWKAGRLPISREVFVPHYFAFCRSHSARNACSFSDT